ncbi:MAG TPA: hypothetical protein VGJ26_17690 [Pirellulales bacterium]|jgi:hypothetical protein
MRSTLLFVARMMAVGACLALATAPQVVRAEGAGIEKKEERKEPPWIPAYALTALGIGLGLMCVARPGTRKNPDGEKEDRPA